MFNGGSAVQLFQGLDTRQLKVSNDKTRNASFDFQSVLSEKTYEQREYDRSSTEVNSDEKLNKQEMTSRKRPEVREATNDKQTVRESKSEKTDQVEKDQKVDEKSSSEESKEVSAIKKLLKKLGMSDEEVAAMLEMIPEDLLADLTQLVQEIPQNLEFALIAEDAQDQIGSFMGSLNNILQELTQDLSNLQDVPTELMSAIENMVAKLGEAQLNLENMTTEAFSQVLEDVISSDGETIQVQGETASEIEVLDVKVVETQTETSDIKPEAMAESLRGIETDADVKTDQDSGEGKSDDQSTNTGAQQAISIGAEQTPSQVDQAFAEAIKIESAAIKNSQPMELASGRVRLAQNIMDQVMQGTKLQLNPTENGQQIMLRLRPEELGNVNLKISVEKGILMAEFQVESQIVKEALESNMSDLKQSLAEKGYSIEGMQVSVGQDQTEQQSQFENRFFNQSSQRKYFFGNEEDLPDFESINKTLAGLQSTFEYLG